MALQSSATVRAAAFFKSALSLAKAISMRLKLVPAKAGIGAVGWQVEQACASRFDGAPHALRLVRRQIVHRHDVAWPERGDEHAFDIGEEAGGVHRSVEHHRRGEGVVAQRPHECRGFPMSVRDGRATAPAASGAPIEAGHLGGGSSLVDERQALGIEPCAKLGPEAPAFYDVRTILFGGVRGFFEGDAAPSEEAMHDGGRKTLPVLAVEALGDLAERDVGRFLHSARIGSASASMRSERLSPPCGLGSTEPVVCHRAYNLIAADAATPKRSAAALRLMPAAIAPTTPEARQPRRGA